MGLFKYKYVNAAGDLTEGQMTAENREVLVERLRKAGHVPITAEEVSGGAIFEFLNRDVFKSRGISNKDLTIITDEMATLLNAGLTLEQTLKILSELQDRDSVRLLMEHVLADVRGGATMADALAARDDIFPTDYISMIRAGEASGALDVVLERLAGYRERADAIAEQVRSAMIYPLILLVLAGVSIVVLLTLVVPQFQPIFEEAGENLPWSTKMLMETGEVVRSYGLFGLGALVLAALAAKQWLTKPENRLRKDQWMLALPLFGELVQKTETARFSRLLGTLLGSGVALLNALSIVTDTFKNKRFSQALEQAAVKVKDGARLADALIVEGIFPRLSMQLLQVGEETGQLEAMLVRTADIYDREITRTIDRLLTLLVPIVTIGLAVIVAGIIGSVLMAILQVNELAF
jgi:general secretion pathway protein F